MRIAVLAAAALLLVLPSIGRAGGIVSTPAGEDAQITRLDVFITWDPGRGLETVVLQPWLQGNARRFTLTLPTPGRAAVEALEPAALFELRAWSTPLGAPAPFADPVPAHPYPRTAVPGDSFAII
jgi:hypothetical protein